MPVHVFAVMPYSREASSTLYVFRPVGYINLGYVNLGKFNSNWGKCCDNRVSLFCIQTTVNYLIVSKIFCNTNVIEREQRFLSYGTFFNKKLIERFVWYVRLV